METGTMLGLAHSLAVLTYIFGVLIQTLPLPKHEWKAHGPDLLWDACVSELAIGVVSTIQLAVNALSSLLQSTIPGPFNSSTASFAVVMSQLVMIDAAIFLLISAVNATVVLVPIAEILARMLGSISNACTMAIVLWSTIYIVIQLFPAVWLTLYELGICFFAMPFRIGRKLGSYLMSGSIVLAVGLPLMPSLAIWLEGYIGYQGFLAQFQEIMCQIQSNPLAVAKLIELLPLAIGNLMAAVVIALIIFPLVYMFMLSAISKGLARLMGGSSGPTLTRFVLNPIN